MKKLVATNIRFPKEELMEYKQMATEEGKSLSEFLRIIVRGYSYQKKNGVKQLDYTKINTTPSNKRDPIFELKPWNSRIKDGAKNHDKYIYR